MSIDANDPLTGRPGIGQRLLFLSHASGDLDRIDEIAGALENAGIEVWIDRSGITGGSSYADAIGAAIRKCDAFLLCVSPAALASRNVRQEIALAWKHERPIVPLLLEAAPVPADLEYWLEATQWIELLATPEEIWLPQVLNALATLGIDITTGVPRQHPAAIDTAGETSSSSGQERSPFGSVLKRFRLAAGLSQEDLAELCNLSVRGISDLERGQRSTPRMETVRTLAAGLALADDQPGATAGSGETWHFATSTGRRLPAWRGTGTVAAGDSSSSDKLDRPL